jgi:hypothetical protein
LIQLANPRLLRSGADGFSVDLDPLEGKDALTADERLIVRLHEIFAAAVEGEAIAVELNEAEAGRVSEALQILELRSKWPPDVQALSRGLQTRLKAAG